MRYEYPCDIVRDVEELETTGREAYVVTFPDVYGCNTGGLSWEESLELAEDALGVALGAYMKLRKDIPVPSPAAPGQVLVPVPLIVAAKLELYTAMREQKVTQAELATRLGVADFAVRRLLNPRHRSHISQVEKALRAVGHSLIVIGCVRADGQERQTRQSPGKIKREPALSRG